MALYCSTCDKIFFYLPTNQVHRRHKTYENMELRVEQSTEPGFRYCSTCETDFYHPINKEHQDHDTYKTRQGLFFNLKYQVLQATQEIEVFFEKLTVEEDTAHSIKTPLQKLKQETEKLIEQHQTISQYYRIASWNLHNLSDTKSPPLYIQRLQSVCKTILYYQFDIVALQEVCTETTVNTLVQMLNENSDLEWDGLRNKTKKEYLTVLYNKYITDGWKNTEQQRKIAGMDYNRKPFSCTLQISRDQFDGVQSSSINKEIVLINTHMPYTDKKQRQNELKKLPDLLSLHDSISHDSMSHDSMSHDSMSLDSMSHDSMSHDSMSHDSMSHVILLGDFNTVPKKLDNAMKSTSHKCILPEGTRTNTAGTRSFDNILVSSTDREHIKYPSVGSIITCKGITAKDVSDHLPIFVDMDIINC